MNLQESVDAIRQDLQRLVHHLTGDKRPGESNHSDGQRDSVVQGKERIRRAQEEKKETQEDGSQWCVRNPEEKTSWGPFQSTGQAWRYIHREINWEGEHVAKDNFIDGSEEERFATFEKIGTYFIERLWIVEAHTFTVYQKRVMISSEF